MSRAVQHEDRCNVRMHIGEGNERIQSLEQRRSRMSDFQLNVLSSFEWCNWDWEAWVQPSSLAQIKRHIGELLLLF